MNMKECHIHQILRFIKLDEFLQLNLAILYVMLITVKYCRIIDWFEKRKSNNFEMLEAYIENLDWFQVLQEEVRQNE